MTVTLGKVMIVLALGSLVACSDGDGLGDMSRKAAAAACTKKLEQVSSEADVRWAPKRAVADKHDRYWEVRGESQAGTYYYCRINAVSGEFLTYVY